jgi:sugar phosphate isomerase/epimerase
MESTGNVPGTASVSFGAQLFAIQDELERDLDGTLREIVRIGYSEVEAANLPDKAGATALKRALDRAGLGCRSAHFHTPVLLGDIAGAIEIAQALGVEYMISSTPWVADPSRRKSSGNPQRDFLALMQSLTLDDWKWNAEQFNRIGEQVSQARLHFGYHNHGFDFRISDGKIAFEELLRLTDPGYVAIEMDCGWVFNAGYDPVDFLQRYPERVQLLHLKDIEKKEPTTEFDIRSLAVGSGAIDWKSVLRAAQATEVAGYFVELEPPFARPPMEQLEASHEFLRSITGM